MTRAATEIKPFDVLIPDPRELGETQATLEQKSLDSLTDDLLARLDGRWVWSYRTFLELRKRGLPVSLTTQPRRGVVTIGHVKTGRACCTSLPLDVPIVACEADRRRLKRYCINIVQSPTGRGAYVPHWPEPWIKPRAIAEPRIKRVGYFGETKGEAQIHEQLSLKLQAIGVEYQVRDRNRWRDYSDIDAVIALRYNWKVRGAYKPPSKLYNAILGRVPLIATPEPAYVDFDPEQSMWRAACNVSEAASIVEQFNSDPAQYEEVLRRMRQIDADDLSDNISKKYKDVIGLAQARPKNSVDYREVVSVAMRDIPSRIKNRLNKVDASSLAK